MKKRLIVLIDFSEFSGNLIRYAGDWGEKTNAELLLIHQTVVMAPALADNESRRMIARQANDEALEQLKALAQTLIPSTVKTSFAVSDQQLHLTLTKLLAESFHNLVLVGMKGTGLLKKIFLGSVVTQVIDNAKGIVAAIPKEISAFSHARIFVAVTDKHPLNILELNNLLNFIDKENTHITFFYLAKPFERTKDMEKQLRDLSVLFGSRYYTSHTIYEGANPFEDIKKVINNQVEEILVVQKGSRLLTDQLFRKFLVNELVYEGQTPLIVLP